MKTFVSALGFGKAPCRLDVEFDCATDSAGPSPSSSSERDRSSPRAPIPVFTNKDTVKGRVQVIPLSLKKVEHLGIRVQLVGEVVLKTEKHPHEFLSVVQDVAPPSDVTAITALPFAFEGVDMPYESYDGTQVSLRYSVRVFMARSMGQTTIEDHFFVVRNPRCQALLLENAITSETNGTQSEGVDGEEKSVGKIKMEVGIEDCLHIEFEYGKNAYHLKDVVIGRINFMLVRIKLKHMELEIKRRETTGTGIDARLESTTVAKYEIMDGAPTKGESIPIRMYLAPYPLTPSYDNIEGKFSVKYGLNLVLVDDEDRRYFKQHEIRLYRLSEDISGTPNAWNLIRGSNSTANEGEMEEEEHTRDDIVAGDGLADERRGREASEDVPQTDDGFSHVPI